MKRFFVFVVILILAKSGFTQIINHHDFSAVCETGQTLYYLITSEEEQTVMLTYPFSEENSWFTGLTYYDGFPEPQGEIILPTIVYYNDTPYSVTAIGDNAFNNCRDLAGTLTIPEGILSVGSRAFRSCGFTSVSIPKSLVEIVSLDYGYGTPFVYCSSLESISVDDENPLYYSENNAIIRRENKTLVVGCKTTTIPDDVETIGRSAFQGSGDGGNLVIPNSVTVIDDYAFYESLFSGTITFSDSLRSIGIKAFSYCVISGSLTIPNSVTEIGNLAFSDCDHLTGNLTLSSSLSKINRGAFKHVGCTGTLIIPNSVNYIGDLAFYLTYFSKLVLGDSVSSIGDAAFNSFDEIYSLNSTPPTLGDGVFIRCDTTIPVHIPFGSIEVYRNTLGWNSFTNFIESEMSFEGEWYYEILNDNGNVTYQYLQCMGDTTLNHKNAKVIVRTNHIYDKKEIVKVTRECIYEEDAVVYWWNEQKGKFTVLYDFNAKEGDEWEIEVGTESVVVHVNSVEDYEYEGNIHRELRVEDEGNVFNGSIIVGLGHTISFFPEKLMNKNVDLLVDGLRCYWMDNTLMYHFGDADCDEVYEQYHHGVDESEMSGSWSVYPNPTNGIVTISTPCNDFSSYEYRIVNLMGQTVMRGILNGQTIDASSLPSGMYYITIDNVTVKFIKQ